jgi:hypothetical protein
MTDMGELDNFLNAKITRAREKIFVSQTHYCLEVLKIFDFLVQGMTAKSPLPIDTIEQLVASHVMTSKGKEEVDSYLYRQIIGALLYVAMYTQPEMLYTVGVLSRHYETITRPELMHHAS